MRNEEATQIHAALRAIAAQRQQLPAAVLLVRALRTKFQLA
jgi:hypothetical protein